VIDQESLKAYLFFSGPNFLNKKDSRAIILLYPAQRIARNVKES
jgi:hypothetical protein